MRSNVAELRPRVDDVPAVVDAEPSDAMMFQSDALDLLLGIAVESVAANSYGVCEYLDTFRLGENVDWAAPAESLAYHGHCHQKAVKKDHHAVGVLRRAGYGVDPLDLGCCSMDGSFGYEAEHHSLSQSIGDILVARSRTARRPSSPRRAPPVAPSSVTGASSLSQPRARSPGATSTAMSRRPRSNCWPTRSRGHGSSRHPSFGPSTDDRLVVHDRHGRRLDLEEHRLRDATEQGLADRRPLSPAEDEVSGLKSLGHVDDLVGG